MKNMAHIGIGQWTRALEMKLVAPMPEQIGTTTMLFCEGLLGCQLKILFWHGCNETQVLGPHIIDYRLQKLIDTWSNTSDW